MSNSKPLEELSEKEFNKLKDAGLLKTIYPKAPDTFAEIRGKRPKPLDNPDFSNLIKMSEQYLDFCQDPDKHRFKDAKHYLFEEVIKCVYGPNAKSGVWDFINKSKGGNLD
jgi:hypothetical protein